MESFENALLTQEMQGRYNISPIVFLEPILQMFFIFSDDRFALSCLILLTQKQLRLTPTLSNCDALLSMLANASLVGVCLAANKRCKTACMLR